MNKHFDGSVSRSTSDNKKLITFPVAHLCVQQAGEAEWQGLLRPGVWHAPLTYGSHICCLKRNPQAPASTKCLGLPGGAADHASTQPKAVFSRTSLDCRQKGLPCTYPFAGRKNGGDVRVWQDKVRIHNLWALPHVLSLCLHLISLISNGVHSRSFTQPQGKWGMSVLMEMGGGEVQ